MAVTRYTEAIEIVGIDGGEVSPCLYLGEKDTPGSWRFRTLENNLQVEQHEGGGYVLKGTFQEGGWLNECAE